MNRMARMLAALAAGTLLALAAGAQAPEKKKITIAVGGKNLFYYLPLSVAERKGYFKDEGLEVEIPDFAGGAKALQALVGGSRGHGLGRLRAHHQHGREEAAHQGGGAAGEVQLHRAAAAEGQGREVQGRPTDLKGLKIGVTAPGSSTNMFVNNLLAKDGLKPTDVSIVGVGAGSGAVAAMEKGEIDAISNLDPVITQLESTGKFVAGGRQPHREGHEGHLRRRLPRRA